jgi:hypothetical protein
MLNCLHHRADRGMANLPGRANLLCQTFEQIAVERIYLDA